MSHFIFVGEQPSHTAYRNGWTWESGRLAAKPLFEALRACGIDPEQCGFVNAFCDHPGEPEEVDTSARLHALRAAERAGVKLVAMGNKVSTLLTACGIKHIPLRHPAARGALRRGDLYASHVRSVLRAA